MLPDGWSEVKLGQVSQILTGGTPNRSTEEYWGGNIPWMSSGEINQRFVKSVAEHITPEGFKNSNARLLPVGTVMIALNGQGKTRAKVALLEIETTCNQSLAGIVSDPQKLVEKYAFHLLDSKYQAIRDITGDDARNGLNLSILRNIECLLPPLAEQKRIAEVLGSVDAAIEATKAVIDQTKTVKQGLLQTLLTRGIGHTKFKDSPLGEIPESWEVTSLGEIISSIDSGWSPDCESEPAGPDEWGVLKTTSVVWEGFDISQNKRLPPKLTARANLQVQERDVLITRAGPSDRVGVVAHVGSVRDKIMLSDKIIRLRFKPGTLDSKFAALFLSSAYAQLFLLGKKSGLAQSQTNISQKILCDMPVAVPSAKEQSNIAGIADELIAAISNEKAKLATLQLLKKGLMDDLLTGKVRVGVPAEKPATNVVRFPVQARTPIRKQALLAAEITAQLYDLQKFGVTKREKIMDICDRHVGLNDRTERRAARREFGSYDEDARHAIDGIFENENWFKIRTETKNGHNIYKYGRGTNFRAHESEFDAEFGDVKSDIQHIIDLLRDQDTRQCEIIDTLYTAWNDLIIERKARNANDFDISNDEIFKEVLDWHPSKGKISKTEWEWGMRWLRQKSLIPTGKGLSSKPATLL